MSGIMSFVCGAAILTAIIVLAIVVLWRVFGRRKRAEDKAIGVFKEQAVYRGTIHTSRFR